MRILGATTDYLVAQTSQYAMTDETRLPDDIAVGPVTLRTSNLKTVTSFYVGILGLRQMSAAPDGLVLGVPGTQLVKLVLYTASTMDERPYPGLFHLALLLPTRASLGQFLIHLVNTGYRLGGASDHGVSEALYLSDPDGNGIEIYRDRDKSEWKYAPNGELRMMTEPLDIESLVRDGEALGTKWGGMPPGTKMGHVHLRVSDVARSASFYRDVVGFDITQGNYPGASFLSAGGYHHHLGINSWQTAKAPPAPESGAGLLEWQLLLPDAASESQLLERLRRVDSLSTTEEYNFAVDPDGIKMLITKK